MILYGYNNIRDLFGHKVIAICPFCLLAKRSYCFHNGFSSFISRFMQVDLGLIKTNPICRLGLWLNWRDILITVGKFFILFMFPCISKYIGVIFIMVKRLFSAQILWHLFVIEGKIFFFLIIQGKIRFISSSLLIMCHTLFLFSKVEGCALKWGVLLLLPRTCGILFIDLELIKYTCFTIKFGVYSFQAQAFSDSSKIMCQIVLGSSNLGPSLVSEKLKHSSLALSLWSPLL